MISEDKKKILDFYNKGLALYKERKWDDARIFFEKVLEIDAEDGPSKLYIDRCEMYHNSPPPDNWDGVFTMTTK
jgi:hypothetical protein